MKRRDFVVKNNVHAHRDEWNFEKEKMRRSDENHVKNAYLTLLYYFNFHPLEVVSRYREPQLQVDENY